MKVLSMLCGRPHLIKAESVHRAFTKATGIEQHTIECRLDVPNDYPHSSDDDFELPKPSRVLPGPTAESLARHVGEAFDEIRPDVLILYGDLELNLVGLTGALQRRIPVLHIESGYRSGDLADPEERTRIQLDHSSTRLVAHSRAMRKNLAREGIPAERVSTFGHPAAQALARRIETLQQPNTIGQPYPKCGLVTFHHHENMVDRSRAVEIIHQISELSKEFDLAVILYRRTEACLESFGLMQQLREMSVRLVNTLTYHSYVSELLKVSFVMTDSSGLQDDCAFLNKPCFVLRDATPRREIIGRSVRLVDIRKSILSLVREAPAATAKSKINRKMVGRLYDESFVRLLRSMVRDWR